jgi:hypothetical protein
MSRAKMNDISMSVTVWQVLGDAGGYVNIRRAGVGRSDSS